MIFMHWYDEESRLLKLMFSEKTTKIWRNLQILSEILEISSYFCGLVRIYEFSNWRLFKKNFNFLSTQSNKFKCTQRCTWTNIKVQKVNRCRRAAKQILSNYISLSYGSYLVILQSRFANNTQKFFFQKRRQMTLWLIDRLTPHKNTNWRVLMRYYELKLFWGSILILLQLHFDEIFMSKS